MLHCLSRGGIRLDSHLVSICPLESNSPLGEQKNLTLPDREHTLNFGFSMTKMYGEQNQANSIHRDF